MSRRKNDKKEIVYIAARNIKTPGFVARNKIEREGIQELADSIKNVGLIHPITIKSVKGGYEVVAGHRRLTAMKKLGMKELPCIVQQGNIESFEILKYEENLKRENLSDMEEAQSLNNYMKLTKLNEAAVAKKIGRSKDYVKQKLAMLKWPDKLYDAIAERKISFSAARELARIKDITVMNEYVKHAVNSGITPSIAKQWADDWIDMQNAGQEEYVKQMASVGSQGYEEVMMPCNVCKLPKKASESRMIRICDDCAKEAGL